MGSIIKDIEILMGENLFEEAEKRLIQYLEDHPTDQRAIEYLSRVEKQLFLQKKSAVQLPNKKRALDELKRIARFEDEDWDEKKKDLLDWIQAAPEAHFVDVSVMLGIFGWNDVGSDFVENQNAKTAPEEIAEAFGFVGRFFLESNHPVRARQWIERALTYVAGKKTEEQVQLWKQLRILNARCIWDGGERQQALNKLNELLKEFKGDPELIWLIENYGREL